MSEEEIKAYCALNRVLGFKNKIFIKTLATFKSPVAFLEASYSEIKWRLGEVGDFAEADLAELKKVLLSEAVNKEFLWLQQENHHLITFNNERYPAKLRNIPDPPPVLFVNGDPQLLGMLQLAIVGCRKSSPLGDELAYTFSQEIANTGIVITSGMALGIDAAAHRGAIEGGGKTLAVLGTGLDIVYPAANHSLAHEIVKNGALVSEFPLGTPAKSFHFPRRNRIVSGLCDAVLVVEAPIKSGALITARLATEQGREVFAIPHSLKNPNGSGCHKLIKNGAKLCESPADILEDLRTSALAMVNEEQQITKKNTGKTDFSAPSLEELELVNKLSPKQKLVLEAMGFDAIRADDLVELTKIPIAEISSILSELEIEGLVDAISGGRYLRC